MADNRIQFSIGSIFSGEGFKKAQMAVQKMDGTMKKSISNVAGMAGSLEGLDANALKATFAMTGMISSLASLNATSILSQAEMTALSFVLGDLNKQLEEANKQLAEAKKNAQKNWANYLTREIRNTEKEVKNLMGDFDAITKRANAFTNAIEGVALASSKGGVADLEIEKLNAMLEAHSDAERETIERTYALKAAIAKASISEQEWTSKREAAQQSVVDAEKKLELLKKQEQAYLAEQNQLRGGVARLRGNGDREKARELEKMIREMDEKRLAKLDEITAQEDEIRRLREVEKRVTIESTNAAKEHEAGLLQLRLADQKASEAAANKAAADKAAAEAAKEKAIGDKHKAEDMSAIDHARQAQEDAAEAAQKLAEAEKAYAEALEEYNRNFLANTIAAETRGKLVYQGTLDAATSQKVQSMNAAHAVDQAIRERRVASVKDALRIEREARREARDAMSRDSGQRAREEQRYVNLLGKNQKTWSKSDRDFVEKYKKILDAESQQKRDLEARKAEFDRQRQIAVDSLDALRNVEKNTEKIEKLEATLRKTMASVDRAIRL